MNGWCPRWRSGVAWGLAWWLWAMPGGLLADAAAEFDRLYEQSEQEFAQGRYSEVEQTALKLRWLAEGPLRDQPQALALALNQQGIALHMQGRYAQAEPLYERAIEIEEKVLGPDAPPLSMRLNNLAQLYHDQGHYAKAEAVHKRALVSRERAQGPHDPDVAQSLNALASIYFLQGRYLEAEPLFRRAIAIQQRQAGPPSADQARFTSNLATLCKDQGRYAEAEQLFRRALAMLEKSLRPGHPDIATSWSNLAAFYQEQGRYGEAEPLYQRALALSQKALGPRHADVAVRLHNLACCHRDQGRYQEAEKLYRQALSILEQALGPEHARVAKTLNAWGRLYRLQGQFAEATALCQRSLVIREKLWGPDHPDLASNLYDMASLCFDQDRREEAQRLVDRAIAILEKSNAYPEDLFLCRQLRAKLAWRARDKADAVAELGQALGLAEQLRGQGAGGDRERAVFFEGFAAAFELMVSWQHELGDVGQALAAIERCRARSLVDQMATHGLDLLAGLQQGEAEQLRRRESEARQQVASLEKQLQVLDARKDVAPQSAAAEREDLRARLAQARREFALVYADTRNASPAYRLAVGANRRPVTLEQLRRWAGEQNALVLEYLIGSEGGWVLVIPGSEAPRLEKLTLDERWGEPAVEPGPLTDKRLAQILVGEKGQGLLPRLRTPGRGSTSKPTTASLAALWRLLIPEAERQALLRRKYQRMVVVPDAGLASVPFEALVIEPGENAKYLLDVAPPVLYAPSATILLNLAQRGTKEAVSGVEPVLTVGEPEYPKPSATEPQDVLLQLAARTRYGTAGGSLKPLPFTGWETSWVGNVFGEQGIAAAQLRGARATEAAVRRNASGRRVLHLACHGLVDQAYGNLFGALALTPGPRPNDPADDGFLTLAELYQLDLQGCELAILSACDTNVGPEQRGEGVWALSRGFLVAGARRVVASNWLVDDEAAASLVSVFCNHLAIAEKEGKPPDYAQALHAAKLWVRQQEKWSQPYYWGTFVLLGPR